MINFGGDIAAKTVRIIEHNTQKQINYNEGYKEIAWANGLPSTVGVWVDSSKAKKLWTYTYTFTGGVPTTIVTKNEDDGITTTKTIAWTNGVPTSITEI